MFHVPFERVCKVASWAIHGGGLAEATGVTWLHVNSQDIRPPIDPRQYLYDCLLLEKLDSSVGLMTSAKLANASTVVNSYGPLWAKTTATVGLGNAMRAGDHPSPSGRIGTINISTEVSVSLSDEAMLEGLAMVTEAKTAAVMDARIRSYMTGSPATGTGTDCAVIASPKSQKQSIYCGKHTQLGHLIGDTTYKAVAQGIRKWKSDNPGHKLLGGADG